MKHFLLLIALVWVSMACSKKEEPPVNIDATTLELNYDEEHQFSLSRGGSAVNASEYTWASSNENVGEVDGQGNFTASSIGETTVTATAKNGGGILESKVTVVPYYTFGAEPSFSFGGSKATIKGYEKRTINAETDSTIRYNGENNNIQGVIYYFEKAAYVEGDLFYSPSVTLTQGQTYYDERYDYIGKQQDSGLTFYIFAISNTTAVGLVDVPQSTGGNVRVGVYLPFSTGGRVSASYLEAAAKRIRAGKSK